MAEIKSTLEKVMERVAAMGSVSPEEVEAEKLLKNGMKLAAQYLQNKLPDPEKTLLETLSGYPGEEQLRLRKGIIQVLLRNIVLPREEDLEGSERAIQGLIDIGGESSGDLVAVMQDMQQILGHYIQHRKQMHEQLETAFKQQLEQAAAQQPDFSGSIDPTLHPKFAEEWQRIMGELNDQYGRALDQHKALLRERMT